jgi:pyruvate dehydrogenase E1 component
MKKLTQEDLLGFRDRLHLDIPDAALDATLPTYYRPAQGSEEIAYLHERRSALGGYLPHRRANAEPLRLPGMDVYDVARRGSGKQKVATTMAFVRLLKDLLKDKEIGWRFVPIIPDEARTFGMDALFPTQKIYSPFGQRYTSVDHDLMLAYTEDQAGVILHEGINEAGSTAAITAAGTSYATHGIAMIPVYIFYSMFGFQRTGDGFWAAADQMTRGFALGATAGRTTLNGEGLQHEDGHSPLLASTNPAVVSYDPAFAFELGHIVRDGLRRMYGEDAEDVFYYLTLYNEPYLQPRQPADVDVAGILGGMHRYSPAPPGSGPKAQLLASGVAVPWALEAQARLHEEWDVQADVWSVTSWSELRRDAIAVEQQDFLQPERGAHVPFITRQLEGVQGPFVAVSDFMRTMPDQIAPWIPGGLVSLGTDGFGLSDTREALRRHFKVDAESISVRTLVELSRRGKVNSATVRAAVARYRSNDIERSGDEHESGAR